MTAKEFYNSRAIKHQLKRAIKHDKQYFEDAIIELMEMYAQEQVKNIAYEPVLAPVNYKQHYIDWRDKYFSKVDKVFEYKTKNKTEYFTTEQLHKKYEKAILESPFNER